MQSAYLKNIVHLARDAFFCQTKRKLFWPIISYFVIFDAHSCQCVVLFCTIYSLSKNIFFMTKRSKGHTVRFLIKCNNWQKYLTPEIGLSFLVYFDHLGTKYFFLVCFNLQKLTRLSKVRRPHNPWHTL